VAGLSSHALDYVRLGRCLRQDHRHPWREALVTGPRLDERAIDTEVFLAQQLALVGQPHDFGEEALDDSVFQQAIAILGEDRVIPDVVVDGQADEPAKCRL